MKFYCNNCGTEFRFQDGVWDDDNCPVCGNDNPDYELIGTPDYETPAQYEKRTGKAFPDNGAVFAQCAMRHKDKNNSQCNLCWFSGTWELAHLRLAKDHVKSAIAEMSEENGITEANCGLTIVIADPPVPPPDNWRPE